MLKEVGPDGTTPMATEHVMTVLGPVDPSEIGLTSMHDHIFWDSSTWWMPESFEDQELTDKPLTPWNAGLARWNALGIRDNLVMHASEYDAQLAEVAEFRAAGGSCLVDPTCDGLDPQPLLLRKMSEELGLHVVATVGLYVHHSHPEWVHQATIDSVADFFTQQLRSGLAGTDVRPGLIGEVGSSNPLVECEEMVLRAAARAGAATGTAVAVHTTAPGRHGLQILDLLNSEGLDSSRIVLCHMDEVLDLEYHEFLLSRGAVVSFDTFGFDGYFARLWKTPSDDEKMRFLVGLLERGWAKQIVMGHDVALKCQLRRFGGLGYDHILRRIAPALSQHYGANVEDVESILVLNPRRILSRPGAGKD